MDIGRWLESLGLGAYAPAFAEHAIDAATLPLLSMEDLKEIGVVPIGHRRRILAAIAGLGEAEPEAETSATPAAEALAGERRQVAVLFADIAGYTALSAGLDAERLHAVLTAYFEAVDEVIGRLGGRVDKHIGDSVMAVFGAPVAHADDVARAVRAALAIHADMDRVSERAGCRLAVHVGIASGEVVASPTGSALHREYTVTGDTVNLASRLTHLAGAGETVVAEDVVEALGDRLEAAPMGPQQVKGLDRPVAAWRVRRFREDAVAADRPLIGRGRELAQCMAVLRTAAEGEAGGVIYVRGEAGIGKSRLLHEVLAQAASLGFAHHSGAVYDFGAGLDRDPMRTLGLALFQSGAGGPEGSPPSLPLKDLLGLPLGRDERARLDATSPAARTGARGEALAELAVAAAAERPLVLAVEDVHWADAGTLRALDTLARLGAERAPIVLVVTSRHEQDPLTRPDAPFAGLTLAVIELGPLRDADARRLAESLLDRTDPLVERCLERAHGHPLFLEQLVRHARTGGLDAAVPGSIRSVVLAQVDRLAPADRAAAQAAAVLGDQFTAAAAAHLVAQPAIAVDRLIAARLVRPDGDALQFSHALIREGIYSSLLQPERRRLHALAADWFAGRDAALRAEHLAKAEDPAAAAAFRDAARALADNFRLEEALDCVDRGLTVATAPSDAAALAIERGALLLELGRPEEARAAYERACDTAPDPVAEAEAKLGLASVLRVVDRLDEALRLLDEAEPEFAAAGQHHELSRLEHLRGNLCFPLGRRRACRDAHQRALEHAEQAGSVELKARALGGLGDAAYSDGRLRQAIQHVADCLAIAREHGLGRVEVAYAPMLVASRLYYGELDGVDAQISGIIAAAREARQARAELIAHHIAMIAHLWQNEPERVEPLYERAQEIFAQIGARRFEAENIALMAEAWRLLGDRDRAIAMALRAVELCRANNRMEYFGAIALGYLAIAAHDDPQIRTAALAEGESLIGDNAVAHNAHFFGVAAIESALLAGEWAEARRHADRLGGLFTELQQTPYIDFVVERGRVLAEIGAGGHGLDLERRLAACRQLAYERGYRQLLVALDAAASGDQPLGAEAREQRVE